MYYLAILSQIVLMSLASLSYAQEAQPMPGRVSPPMPMSTSSQSAGRAVCESKDVVVLLDNTGSFVDHILNKDLFTNSTRRIRADFPRLCVGSEVKVAILGHSHRDVSGTYDHLTSKNFTVSRNHYTADNLPTLVIKQLESWRDDLASGKIKQAKNTAVAMAFDNLAEVVELRARPTVVWAITDGDETELGGVPAPYKPNQLKGVTIYMLGAGVTLTDGTNAQRKLRAAWEHYFQLAGAENFFWVSKP
jgi:hypothetical protein